ncbi:MAG: nucleotidyltransferase family protein [Methanocorpusculum sp.]|nr:nucleotidyltransferase family protein [Methanocorpusculum sp.]
MSGYISIKEEVLSRIGQNMPEIQSRFGIESLGIFGSVSRGEDTVESDIDVLYRFSTPSITLSQFMGLKEYLEDLFGRNVDLVSLDWIEPKIELKVKGDMILFSAPAADV